MAGVDNARRKTMGRAGGKGSKKPDENVSSSAGGSGMTDKELLLTEELQEVNRQLAESRNRISQLREENMWLQEEAQKVRLENQEYMSYMEKKTAKRQTAIISLSDHHHKQLQDLQEEERHIRTDFEAKKQELLATLMEKEVTLAKVNREMDDLQEYKMLQQEQSSQIRDLEREILSLRGQHSSAILQLKASFLAEKQTFQRSTQAKIEETARQANKDAVVCLNEHKERVRVENRHLRHELLLLIRKSEALHAHKRRLEEQRQELLRERQYALDLRAIRGIDFQVEGKD